MTANKRRQVDISNMFTFGFLALLCARTCYSCYYALLSCYIARGSGDQTYEWILFVSNRLRFFCSSSTLILAAKYVPVHLHDNHDQFSVDSVNLFKKKGWQVRV